jgi:hypothetical protein
VSNISDPVITSLPISGIWLHDPADPMDTVTNFPYGKSARSSAIDIAQTSLVFSGRRYPVTEYSDNQQDQFSVRVDIPNDENYFTALADMQSFAASRSTVMLRDNRGRAAYGSMSGYREDDQDWGVQITFTLARVDYGDVTTVVLS